MVTSLAIVVGDTHLAERTWANRRTLTGDSFNSFLQATTEAIRRRLPMVLLGDIFDAKNLSSGVLQFFCDHMDKLQEQGIPVYYVQGNHDCVTPPWPAVHKWPIHINGTVIRLGVLSGLQCECYGLDYFPIARYVAELSRIPETAKVLFTHQAWADFGKMGSSDAAMAQMLPRGITVATGDLHIAMYSRGTAANGDGVLLMSPGATCMQAINEPQQHFIYEMRLQDDGVVSFDPIPLHTRLVYEFRCTTQTEFDAAVMQIAGLPKASSSADTWIHSIDTPIVRIKYPISVSEDSYVRLVSAATKSGSHLFTDPQLEAVTQSTLSVEDVHTERMSTLSDAIQLLEAEPQEVRDLAARMLDKADNVLGFLSEFQKEYVQGAV